MANRTARHWCFTINHPDTGANFVYDWPNQFDSTVRYVVFQCEICPKTKREHIQGYIEMHAPTTMKKIQAYIGDRVHVEARKGTRIQARSYCMKPDTRAPDTDPFEWGVWNEKGQGHRSDLDAFIDVAKRNGMKKAVDEIPAVYVKYHAGMEKMYDYYKCDDTREIRTVHTPYRKGMFVLQPSRNDDPQEYMRGYRGQKIIFVKSNRDIRHWMTDGYPLYLRDRWAEWTTVAYATDYDPDHHEPFDD